MSTIKNVIESIFEKCDILLDNQVFSKEVLLKTFGEFLADTIEKDDHNIGFVLHTGSICFDAIAVIYSALVCIINNNLGCVELLTLLPLESKVLYGDKRQKGYIFKGFETVGDADEKKVILLQEKDGNRLLIGKKSWNLIIPYFGNAKNPDGRGIKKNRKVRDDFFMDVLGYDEKDIPNVINASGILVMERTEADYLLNNLSFSWAKKKMGLLELVTASYFTEENEYYYSGNAGKNEAVIKVASNISAARNLVHNQMGNLIMGVYICGSEIISRGITEISWLINKHSLQYVYICMSIEFDFVDSLLEKYEAANVFACTREFLLSNSASPIIRNSLTRELYKQVQAIIEKDIVCEIFSCSLSWNEYQEFKRAIYTLRMSSLDEDEKNTVIMLTCMLFNLFFTAIFPIVKMDKIISEKKIAIELPEVRLRKLEDEFKSFPNNFEIIANEICNTLKKLYLDLRNSSEKEIRIKKVIWENYNKKIVIVVPKAYYNEILREQGFYELVSSEDKLTVVTPNRFNNKILYDIVVVVGDFYGKKFDAFRCKNARKVIVLLYEPEIKIFNLKWKKYLDLELSYNKRSTIPVKLNGNRISEQILVESEEDLLEVQEIDRDIENFVYQYHMVSLTNLDAKIQVTGNNMMAEVVRIVCFETGERAFLTKYYRAYIVDEFNGKGGKDINVAELREGDLMIFSQDSNERKDIVEYILGELVFGNKIDQNVITAYEKSRKWKLDLIDYMRNTGDDVNTIARKMISRGAKVHEATIKNWLNEDSHIVGPQKIDSIQQIALLTGNDEMYKNAIVYFDACRLIRGIRKRILKEVGFVIVDKYNGKKINSEIIPKELMNQIEELAEVLRIEKIIPIEKKMSINITNRPINF